MQSDTYDLTRNLGSLLHSGIMVAEILSIYVEIKEKMM